MLQDGLGLGFDTSTEEFRVIYLVAQQNVAANQKLSCCGTLLLGANRIFYAESMDRSCQVVLVSVIASDALNIPAIPTSMSWNNSSDSMTDVDDYLSRPLFPPLAFA
jgi:hypothetical protein